MSNNILLTKEVNTENMVFTDIPPKDGGGRSVSH